MFVFIIIRNLSKWYSDYIFRSFKKTRKSRVQKKFRHCVGQVLHFDKGDPLSECMSKNASSDVSTSFRNSAREDISSIEKKYIVRFLLPPKIGRRREANFD